MARPTTIAVLCLLGATVAFSAEANPGARLLTAGGSETRLVMTQGVSYDAVNGVHVFKGSPALLGAETAPPRAQQKTGAAVKTAAPVCVWRSLRRLRTQGFYSGDRYPSRRYTQGFYSGR